MADGVAQVQELAAAGVKFILLHQVALVGDAAGHHFLRVLSEVPLGQGVQQVGVPDHAVLDDLGAAVREDVGGQGRPGIQVAQDGLGLVKGPGQVLAVFQVNGGLAPHGGIHRRQQRRGQLKERDPPQIGRGSKPRQVPDDPAAQGDQPIGAGQMFLGQVFQQREVGMAVLVLLPGGEDEGQHGEARPLQAVGGLAEVVGGNVAVGDDTDAPALKGTGGLFAQGI